MICCNNTTGGNTIATKIWISKNCIYICNKNDDAPLDGKEHFLAKGKNQA